MENEYIEVIGSQPERPQEVDTTSSQFYVYERKDIQEYEEKDEQQNVVLKGWKYLERKVPREQWMIEMASKVKDLESQLSEQQETNMLMMTDLYELQLEAMGELDY